MDDSNPFDRRVWRQLGDPLVGPSGTGLLDGETLAVKDVIAVKGQRTGAGNPTWLNNTPVNDGHAVVIDRLLKAGASITGITRCDEFGFGMSGVNEHYGAPPNPMAPGRVSGGSSSASATAVALGQASIGLGTDTAGSIRVPAAYQGLWGFRATPGVISSTGVMALAPTFDTVGWLARDPDVLRRVGKVLLPYTDSPAKALHMVTADELIEVADDDIAKAVKDACRDIPRDPLGLMVPDHWVNAFATVQAYEAWAVHGNWVQSRLGALGGTVRRRFERGSQVRRDVAVEASVELAKARRIIVETIGDKVLVIPTVPTFAPPVDSPDAAESVRRQTLQLTCVASIACLPVLSVPLPTQAGMPTGLSFIGPSGSDRMLLDVASTLA